MSLFPEHVLGRLCSPASVVKLQAQAATALRPTYEELVGQTHAILNVVETCRQQSRSVFVGESVRADFAWQPAQSLLAKA